jgi:hypothetical protein
MAKFKDPIEIYRESLKDLPVPAEEHPPRIERAEAWPYPELDRIWIRLEISPFATHPNLAFALLGPDGQAVSTMDIVEIREPYQSLTLHLRQPPRPGEPYRLAIELSRGDAVLDTRFVDFELVYREPHRTLREDKADDG